MIHRQITLIRHLLCARLLRKELYIHYFVLSMWVSISIRQMRRLKIRERNHIVSECHISFSHTFRKVHYRST